MSRHTKRMQDNPPTPNPDEVVILNFAVGLVNTSAAHNGIVAAASPPRKAQVNLKIDEKESKPPRPSVLPGQGVSGVVVRVGVNVTRFHEGQRVIAQCQPKKLRTFPQVAYSQFSVSIESLVAAIPETLSYEQAATLPLSITLAAAGLYQRNHLDSPLPRSLPRATGETILVMDGASDVGAMVVQLAAASNMRVIATASRRNVDIVKSFGASVVVCHDPFVEGDLVAALDSLPLAGVYDTMSTKQSFAEIDALLHETMQTTPVCALMPPAQGPLHFSPSVVVSTTINRDPHIFVRDAVWHDFLPRALERRRLRAKPSHTVIRARRQDVDRAMTAVDVIPRKVSDGMIVISFA